MQVVAIPEPRRVVNAERTTAEPARERGQPVSRMPAGVGRRPSQVPISAVAPVASPVVQRACSCGGSSSDGGQCADCAKDHERGSGELQRRRPGTGAPALGHGSPAPHVVHGAIGSAGQPLPDGVRADFERRFVADFSGVRVHTDELADRSARAVQATAFTVANHVVFSRGAYAPQSTSGHRLLAHELTHVIQQNGGAARPSNGPLRIDTSGEAAAERAESGPAQRAPSAGVTGLASHHAVQRQALPFEVPEIPELPGGGFPDIGDFGEIPDIEEMPDIGELPESGEGVPETGDGVPETGDGVPDTGEGTPGAGEEPGEAPRAGPKPGPWPGPVPVPVPFPHTDPGEPDKDEDKSCGTPRLPRTVVTWATGPLGQPKSVTARPLTMCAGNTRGSIASRSLYRAQRACIKAKLPPDKSRQWVWSHMLHGMTPRTATRSLHGPGNQMWNIIIAHKDINDAMFQRVEWQALSRAYDLKQTLWYEASVDAYHPGAEFFAKSITVRYGLLNPVTGAAGPAIVNQAFSSPEVPPACPPTAAAGAGSPGAKPGAGPPGAGTTTAPKPTAKKPAAPPPAADFTRKIEQMCFRLESGRFTVKKGGLKVTFRTRWMNPKTGCLPNEQIFVILRRHNRILSDDTVSSTPLTPGRIMTLTWRHLPDDDYYFVFATVPWHSQQCCLTGDLSFFAFDAPRPSRHRKEPDIV
jgi:hypothetical protein